MKWKVMAACLAATFVSSCARAPVAKTDSVYGYRVAGSPGFRAVLEAARLEGVNPAFALAVARKESGGRCDLTSPKGAMGVLQLMPATAKRHGVKPRNGKLTCKESATAGVRELKRLLILTHGDQRKALIGYNCGEACIKRKRLPHETKNYIKTIARVSYAMY
jgi:soluble lytic murein transglycosylase-like protein